MMTNRRYRHRAHQQGENKEGVAQKPIKQWIPTIPGPGLSYHFVRFRLDRLDDEETVTSSILVTRTSLSDDSDSWPDSES